MDYSRLSVNEIANASQNNYLTQGEMDKIVQKNIFTLASLKITISRRVRWIDDNWSTWDHLDKVSK